MNPDDEIAILRRRMKHLLEVEFCGGVAHGTRARPSWATSKIAPFTLTTTAARLRALVEAGSPEARDLIDGIPDEVIRSRMWATLDMPGAPRRSEPVTAWFDEALLGAEAPIEERMAQWIRRLVYLTTEEGLIGELRKALITSWAMMHMIRPRRPDTIAFLLHEVPRRPPGPERDAVLYALQYRTQTVLKLDMSEEEVMRTAINFLETLSHLARDVPPEILRELVATGVLSARFHPYREDDGDEGS